jgi:hypothetical protein
LGVCMEPKLFESQPYRIRCRFQINSDSCIRLVVLLDTGYWKRNYVFSTFALVQSVGVLVAFSDGLWMGIALGFGVEAFFLKIGWIGAMEYYVEMGGTERGRYFWR